MTQFISQDPAIIRGKNYEAIAAAENERQRLESIDYYEKHKIEIRRKEMALINTETVPRELQTNPETICIRHKYLEPGQSFVMTDNNHIQHVASKDDNDGIVEVPFLFGKGLTGHKDSIWEVVDKPENLVVVEVDPTDTYSVLGKPKMTVADVEHFIEKNPEWFDQYVKDRSTVKVAPILDEKAEHGDEPEGK